ncbi:HipA family kinase [Flavobacterium phycosphaerae]|uniref:HipA family kinase n=1 Tax=Flavobacterium phycosphaerae TaxID=2697515 RepID=UPI001389DAB6|nr:HipA family kinase [Flavobacterium phycosphaerae]
MSIQNKNIISIIKKFPTDGHSPYLALNDEFEEFVVKPPQSQYDFGAIKKEFLCALLLPHWSLLTPPFFSCNVSQDLLAATLMHDNRFKLTDSYFASLFIEDVTELNQLFEFKGKVALKSIRIKEDLIRLALFDVWVENDDRKPTNSNVLLKSTENQFDIYAIDHAFTFASVALDSLYIGILSFSDNDSILYSELGKELVRNCEINDNWLKEFEQYFYLCIQNCRENFKDIINKIPETYQLTVNEINCLQQFLFDDKRNKEVLSTLFYIINDIRK